VGNSGTKDMFPLLITSENGDYSQLDNRKRTF